MKNHLKSGAKGLAIASVLALAACDEAIMLAPGSVDPNDTCSRFQTAIADARQKENDLRIQNAVAGAAVGALVGAVLGGDSAQDRRRGAVFGALLGGGLAAGTTTNAQTQARAADAEVLREVNSKAGQARSLLTDAGRAANSLRTCRLRQIATLERDVRNGSVSDSEARARLATLQRRANADNRLISASFNGIGQRVDSFVNTSSRASGVEGAIITRQQAARNANARRVASATSNVPRAISTRNRVVTADQQQQRRVENGLREIEVLLG